METLKNIKYKIALTNNPEEAKKLYSIIKERRRERRRTLYRQHKEEVRRAAQEWQTSQEPQTWADIATACDYFQETGERYGLIKELRTEGII